MELNRQEYSSEKGIAAWWQKDGAWHIALPRPGCEGFFWTATQYGNREDAIKALEQS